MKPFWKGFASVLNLWPAPRKTQPKCAQSSDENDKAIRANWQSVENDIRSIVSKRGACLEVREVPMTDAQKRAIERGLKYGKDAAWKKD